MKKGLLSILASALLVVGCQNYDDQFSNLESQISALATTVAGLAQVQSDLSSLAGTVASLSSTVNGLGSTIDTAVANGLADIQADVDAITTAVADVASSEEVDALATAVADAGADLDELLANSSVFTGTVTINSAATLAAFKKMGSSLAIVNGSVDIDVSATMNQEDVQTVVNEILTVTGEFNYSAAAKVAETTFKNLSGTQTLTLKQEGGYELQGLVSAGVITLDATWATTQDIIHLGALTTATSINAGTIAFGYADEIHLTSLTYYEGGDLSITGKKGGVIAMGALTDTNAAGVVTPFDLTVSGPSALTITGIAGDTSGSDTGKISVSDVATVNISKFGGLIDINDGVDTVTLSDVAVTPTLDGATDMITLNLDGVVAYGKSFATLATTPKAATLYTAAFIDLAITSVHNDLETVNLSGSFDTVSFDGATSLATIKLAGTYNDVDVKTLGDLVSLTTPAAKINDLEIDGNNDLLDLVLDFDKYTTVTAATTASPVDAAAGFKVTNNAKLASLLAHPKSLYSLDISTNAKLASINLPFLATVDAGTAASMKIKANALVVASVTDNYDKTAAGVAIATGTEDGATNTGTYGTNPLSSIKAWVDAVILRGSTATLEAWFDTVTELQTVGSTGTIVTTNPGANATQTLANAGTVWAAVYVLPTVIAVSNQAGAIAGEVRSYVYELKRNNLGAVLALGAGEGFVVKYGSDAADIVTFAQDATARTTVQSLVDYMNADTSLAAANLNIDAALDSSEKYIYNISYLTTTNSVNTAGVVSNGGTIYATFGSTNGTLVELSQTVETNDDATDIAEGFRVLIDALADYNATTITAGANGGTSFSVTRDVSGTETVDKSPLMAAPPTLSIVVDIAGASTTAILGANTVGYQSASHLSNTYNPLGARFSLSAAAPTKQSNLRVTLRDTSGLGMSSNVTMTAASGANSNTAITTAAGANTGALQIPYLLVDGTSITSAADNTSTSNSDATATTYYVAAGANNGVTNTTVTGVTGKTTDRTAWL
ncbi:hypothetical protein N9926_01530 [Flavobacteriaceae bacterium]|nr:hypothetical protein [Flavobacteriaceae bacterium]